MCSFPFPQPKFISRHHSDHKDHDCKLLDLLTKSEVDATTSADLSETRIDLKSTEKHSVPKLSKMLAGKWSAKEAKIFENAVQVCGKNFSAIKKEHLPWKSVRSIIEYYYICLDQKNEAKHKKASSNDKPNDSVDLQLRQSTSSSLNDKSKMVVDDDKNHSSSDGKQQPKNASETDHSQGKSDPFKEEHSKNGSLSSKLSNESKLKSVAGQEVKPLKAKAITSRNEYSTSSSDPNANSTLGSLNLYLHGELVLKLDAQQKNSGQKWVESMHVANNNKKKRSANSSSSTSNYRRGLKKGQQPKYKPVFKSSPKPSSGKSPTKQQRAKHHETSEDSSSSDKELFASKRQSELDNSSINGDLSESDDDSLSESSSMIASSPSSCSTISSVAKKARVNLDNSSKPLNGNNNLSSPSSFNRKMDSISSRQQRTSPSAIELEFKKKILEANLNLFRPENGLQALFDNPQLNGLGSDASKLTATVVSELFSSKASKHQDHESLNGFKKSFPSGSSGNDSNSICEQSNGSDKSPRFKAGSSRFGLTSPRSVNNNGNSLFSPPAPVGNSNSSAGVSPNGLAKLKKSLIHQFSK